MMTALTVIAVIGCLGLTAIAIERRWRRTHQHMRPVHLDSHWARFDAAMRNHAKEPTK